MARKSRKNIESAPVQAVKVSFNAGAYVRLSAVDKKHKGDSIETQQAIIEAFIMEHSDISLREVYIDNGLSGQTFERPAFQRMLADMESGKINCCITKDLSRLGRNAIDTGFYIERHFPQNNVRFIAITDGYDSANGQSGGIMVSLKNMVNESYALEIGRKIRTSKQMNISLGKFVGSFAPYGFIKDPKDNHKLLRDPEAAPIVQRIFEMAADGASIKGITKWLNESGILPPMRYLHSKGIVSEKQARGHIHWNKGALYTILKNRVYCGDMVQGKGKTNSYVQERIPESEWIVVEDTHESIVSRELFAKVQARWGKEHEPQEQQKPKRKRNYSTPSAANIFQRKVFCGHCGFTMLRHRINETQYRFKCHTQDLYDKSDCVCVGIHEDMIKEMLLGMFLIYKADIGTFPNTGLLTVGPSQADEAIKAELRTVQADIRKNSHYLEGLYESLVTGDLTDSEFREMKEAYETKIAALTKKEKDLRNEIHNSIRKQAELSKANTSIQATRGISDITADVVNDLIERIHVFEDKSIKVKFTFADEEVTSGGIANGEYDGNEAGHKAENNHYPIKEAVI